MTTEHTPVAWMYDRARYGPTDLRGQQWLPELSRLKPYEGNGMVRGLIPLYTTPPQQSANARKPMTYEMTKQMRESCDSHEMRGAFVNGWLSSEAAHGIKENP